MHHSRGRILGFSSKSSNCLRLLYIYPFVLSYLLDDTFSSHKTSQVGVVSCRESISSVEKYPMPVSWTEHETYTSQKFGNCGLIYVNQSSVRLVVSHWATFQIIPMCVIWYSFLVGPHGPHGWTPSYFVHTHQFNWTCRSVWLRKTFGHNRKCIQSIICVYVVFSQRYWHISWHMTPYYVKRLGSNFSRNLVAHCVEWVFSHQFVVWAENLEICKGIHANDGTWCTCFFYPRCFSFHCTLFARLSIREIIKFHVLVSSHPHVGTVYDFELWLKKRILPQIKCMSNAEWFNRNWVIKITARWWNVRICFKCDSGPLDRFSLPVDLNTIFVWCILTGFCEMIFTFNTIQRCHDDESGHLRIANWALWLTMRRGGGLWI